MKNFIFFYVKKIIDFFFPNKTNNINVFNNGGNLLVLLPRLIRLDLGKKIK